MLALVLCLFAVACYLTYLTKEARKHQRQNIIHQNNHKYYMESLDEIKPQINGYREEKTGEKDAQESQNS
jgi:lipopolysaccharide export system protein LptC